ncbi:phosphatidate cytidylyltransferase [Sphingomonas spermidinifaciens]|uniref:Phosphatidate cytidylyltransferase n=1 Tax=Sphingomonas spermidinifaciens TaxID=1141889 RepID=A0A2A4B9H4_9SPHN|nr:phosphatidate cytidylyltransferase [Sphingomonas spermidinifaciens]PCD04602.1 phosphatidate cytidylyltransferase [Sphingomonas spermidinifaciens]
MADDRARRKANLNQRLAVGFSLLALAFCALWWGGFIFWLVVVIGALVMMSEWSTMFAATPRQKRLGQLAISVPLAIMAPIASGPSFFSLGLVVGAAFFVGAVTGRRALAGGILYVALPALALLLLRSIPDGLFLSLWAMGLVWACDTAAFFVGRSVGGPRLAPSISPNKTWSGLIGGLVAAAVLGFIMAQYGLSPWLAAMTPVLAVVSALGDLYESWLKRRAGIKDSGTLLPGHGGMLDRLDGIVPVAPLAALMVIALGSAAS